MANAKVCDECGKVLEEVHIKLNGHKVEMDKKYGYEIKHAEDFCSFNCLSKYAEKQQEFFEANKAEIERVKLKKYRKENKDVYNRKEESN